MQSLNSLFYYVFPEGRARARLLNIYLFNCHLRITHTFPAYHPHVPCASKPDLRRGPVLTSARAKLTYAISRATPRTLSQDPPGEASPYKFLLNIKIQT